MELTLNLKNLNIAHRGIFNNIDIPENSLKAFKLAVSKNIPVELDVQLTKDNVLVVFHDDNLYRMTGCNQDLKDMNYQDIKKLFLLNTKEKIPTLKEVLELVNNKVLIDIEIKRTKKINKICQLLLEEITDYKNNVIVKSFDPLIIYKIKKTAPYIIRGLLIKNRYDNKLFEKIMRTKFILNICKPNFIAISKSILKNEVYLEKIKNIPIFVWTIENKEELKKINKKDFSYICNNLPYKK